MPLAGCRAAINAPSWTLPPPVPPAPSRYALVDPTRPSTEPGARGGGGGHPLEAARDGGSEDEEDVSGQDEGERRRS